MTKRVFIVHGWDGYPEEGWFPWLKIKLEKHGFEVYIPQLPEPSKPRIYNWVPALAQTVGTPDDQTFFVGHSMGCQTIARYLESLQDNLKVGGVVFVAGFLTRLAGLEDDDIVRDVSSHWMNSPLDLARVKSHITKSTAIFSNNDPFVPLDNQDAFRDQLGSKIIIVPNAGHFSGSRDQCFQLPIVLEKLLEIDSSL